MSMESEISSRHLATASHILKAFVDRSSGSTLYFSAKIELQIREARSSLPPPHGCSRGAELRSLSRAITDDRRMSAALSAAAFLMEASRSEKLSLWRGRVLHRVFVGVAVAVAPSDESLCSRAREAV